MTVTEFETDEGVTVLMEELVDLHSVTVGVWVRVGSRHEAPAEHGMSHLVEHMLFKGTRRRTSLDIARALEAVGGELNAFTSREYTCFFARAPHDHLRTAMDVLLDQVAHSVFETDEFRRERRVIQEEIRMYADSPDDLCSDELSRAAFDLALGHPITGTVTSVRRIRPESARAYHRRMYSPRTVFLTVVGRADAAEVRDCAESLRWPEASRTPVPSFPQSPVRRRVRALRRELEQTHLCLAWPGLSASDPDRYQLHVINTHLGTGLSSRLFQVLREERGLVYSTHSFTQSYSGVGLFGVYCALEGSHLGAAIDLVRREVEALMEGSIDEEVLRQLRDRIRGGLMLSMERPSFRMNRMAICHMNFGRLISVDEILGAIDRITPADIRAMSRRLFGAGPHVALTVGRPDHRALRRALGQAA